MKGRIPLLIKEPAVEDSVIWWKPHLYLRKNGVSSVGLRILPTRAI